MDLYVYFNTCNLSSKGFEIKTFPLVEQFFGGVQGLPIFFSQVRVSGQGEIREAAPFIPVAFIEAALD